MAGMMHRVRRALHAAPKAAVASLPQALVFAKMTQLAAEHGAVNLGQGFPSWPTPDFVLAAAEDVLRSPGAANQYSKPGGHPVLLDAIARFTSPRFGRAITPANVVVTSGAQGAIFDIFATFCEQGDEAVCIEPAFEMYGKIARVLGSTVRGVPLGNLERARTSEELSLDVAALEAAINERTRLLILNTPHNPTGKVFSRAEYEAIAELVRRHPRLVVVADDVYECMVLGDGLAHVNFASLDGMWDRTVSVYSAGKAFSCTGWRIGYCVAPAELVGPLSTVQSCVSFCAAAPFELALARAFDEGTASGYFGELEASLRAKRDALTAGLAAGGLRPIVPGGGYFVVCHTGSVPAGGPSPPDALADDTAFARRRDYIACSHLTTEVGVTGLPIGGFFSAEHRHLSDSVLRFAFCKTDDEIAEASRRLSAAALSRGAPPSGATPAA